MPDESPDLEILFHRATDLSGDKLQDFLTDLEARDPRAAAQLRALLEQDRTGSTIGDAVAAHRSAFETIGSFRPRLGIAAPQGQTPTTESIGKYTLHGEVAHGGIGMVFRGTDREIGRDVAVKMVRPEWADDHRVLERFVEEAQIGGQLQHPGIVPVYDLGEHNQRPYFSMKLIEGKSLAELLGQRRGLHADHARFLAVFEQICQTLSYAHSRGVIHRDLKPANVMVGAFGETQVVDWGLAKVLGNEADESSSETPRAVRAMTARESMPGTVMGTPAYMPPEQARGDIGGTDRRADVFALGAILLEILTGAPPYGGGMEQALERARNHDIDDARRQLAACGAEASLIDLATDCLARDLADRPEHAGVVAERVVLHIATVEQRVRQARIEAAAQQAKAQEARRAQRLTVALSLTGLLLVAVVYGGFSWIETERQIRQTSLTADIDRHLDAATRLYGAAERAGPGQELPWALTRQELNKAIALAASDDAAGVVRTRVATFQAKLDAAESAARELAAQQAKDEAMRARLEEIRHPASSDIRMGSITRHISRRSDRQFSVAFRDYGIDFNKLDTSEIIARVRASRIRSDLVDAITYWMYHRRRVHPNGADGARRSGAYGMLDVANQVDDDPVRRRLRQLFIDGADDPEFVNAKVDARTADPRTAEFAAVCLPPGEDVRLLQVVNRIHPADFSIVMVLGLLSEALEKPNWNTIRGHYRVAVSLRPRNGMARLRLALADLNCGDHKEAIQGYRAVIHTHPDYAEAHVNLAMALRGLRRHGEALEVAEKAVEVAEDYPLAWQALGVIREELGKPDQAIEAYEQGLRLAPRTPGFLSNLGNALAAKQDFDQAISKHREAVEIEPDSRWLRYGYATVLAQAGKFDQAVRELKRAAKGSDPDRNRFGGKSQVPTNIDYLIKRQLGAILLNRDGWTDLTHAAEALRTMEDAGAKCAADHANLAAAHLKLSHRRKALEHAELAIQGDADHAGAHAIRAEALFFSQDFRSARSAFERVLSLGPENALTLGRLGACLLKLGRFDEALDAFTQTARTAPPSLAGLAESGMEEARQLVAKEPEIQAVMRGDKQPRDIHAALEITGYALGRDDYIAARRLAMQSLNLDGPAETKIELRYRAACASAATSANATQLAKSTEASTHRSQALHMLRQNLTDLREGLADDPRRANSTASHLDRSLWCPLLDSIRKPSALARLSAKERVALAAFWNEVEALRQTALAVLGVPPR